MVGNERAGKYDRILGERLRALRKSRSKSLSAVGELLGVSYQQMQKYETGSNRLSAGKARVLAEEFGMSLDNLFGVEESNGNGIDWELLTACEKAKQRLDRKQLLKILKTLAE